MEYQLIFEIMRATGLPEQIVRTWEKMYQKLQVHYKAAGSLTDPQTRENGFVIEFANGFYVFVNIAMLEL